MTLEYRHSHTAENFGTTYEDSFKRKNYKNFIYQWEREVVSQIFRDCKPDNYLDFACGTGRITRIAEGLVDNINGVDVSESMLGVAREQVKSANFILEDITRGEFKPERKFDFVSSFRFFTNAQPSLRKEVFESLLDLMTDDSYFLFNLHMNSTSSFALAARGYETLFGKREGFNHLDLKTMDRDFQLLKHFDVVSVHTKGVLPVVREGKERSNTFFRVVGGVESVASYLPLHSFFSKYHIVLCKRK